MNHLSKSQNPYLLQHAANPVWWHAWGDEAFALAQKQNRLIFLSIGYSTCHWCHVMEHESFESQEIADIMNAHFVSIKVDREEHPDVDHVYMEALHVMGARGGWPLNMFLTPDRKPFYGGTYFPKDNFAQILTRMADLWQNRTAELQNSAEQLKTHLARMQAPTVSESVPIEETLARATEYLRMNEDLKYGGFAEAPKFPPNFQIALLNHLLIWIQVKPHALREFETEFRAAEMRVLISMTGGGLFDHLEGGFFRYTVDREWTIPHFEKMLYNQALNLISMVESRNPHFDFYIEQTISYMKIRLQTSKGGFYAAEDADSLDPHNPARTKVEEGLFYVWKYQELEEHLGGVKFAELKNYFDISTDGNFEHATVHLRLKHEKLDTHLPLTVIESLQKLKGIRSKRPRPFRDSKLLTGWNALAITALARTARMKANGEALAMAVGSGEWIWKNMWNSSSHTLFRREIHSEIRSEIHSDIHSDIQFEGTLEDFAFAVQGFLELYLATSDSLWLERARTLQAEQDRSFVDPEGGYFLSSNRNQDLPVRTKDFTDQATPNANGITYGNLMTFFRLTGEAHYRDQARRLESAAQSGFLHYPNALSGLLSQILEHGKLAEEWVVVTTVQSELEALKIAFATFQRPGRLILFVTPAIITDGPALVRDKVSPGMLYRCQDFSCNLPEPIATFLQRSP